MKTAIHHRLIESGDEARWAEALEGLPHYYAHRLDYCRTMAGSSGLRTLLYAAEAGSDKIACPLSVREKEAGFPELVSPYGFGGIVATRPIAEVEGFREGWTAFARENGFVTAYVMQHPLSEVSGSEWNGELHEHHGLYVIDLTADEGQIWKNMRKAHRYEVRRSREDASCEVATDRGELTEALLKLYPQTVERVGASDVYRFSTETLKQIARAPDSLLLGVRQDGSVQAVTLFLHTPASAEYFLNASSPDGRRHTRLLVWTAITELKKRGVPVLNLGGGAKPDDPLDQFKRRFGGRTVPGQVLKQVFDPEKYRRLCDKYAAEAPVGTGFFPPYWRTG